jgi:surfeit locus 1 family protein
MNAGSNVVERGPRRTAALVVLALIGLLLFVSLVGLGTWQVYRRAWKLDLIARVDQRVHAAAVAPPGPDQWPQVTAAADEYRHVRITGTFLNDRDTRVQASTDLGSGYWLMTPLRMANGDTVLINRGFIPPDWKPGKSSSHASPLTITGLLRITEPRGGFLRKNDPAGNRWFSRDVQAIAAARQLSHVAPYFVDADAAPAADGDKHNEPVGGLTVIAFPNNHLVYSITWYLLALMVAFSTWRVGREEMRLRRRQRDRSNVLETR